MATFIAEFESEKDADKFLDDFNKFLETEKLEDNYHTGKAITKRTSIEIGSKSGNFPWGVYGYLQERARSLGGKEY